MGSGKPRWKLSFHRSPLTSPSSSITTEAPMEFVCPISRSIMADPVIVPSGQTFERSCIQVCRDLTFTPPSLAAAVDLSPDVPFLLIPNVALRAAIIHWCDRAGLPPPVPVSLDAARALVRRLMSEAPLPPAVGAVSNGEKAPILEGGSKETPILEGGTKEMMTPETPPQSVRSSKTNSASFSPHSSLSSSSCNSSSSYSSSEIMVVGSEEALKPENPQAPSLPASKVAKPTAGAEVDCLEEEILIKLMDSEDSEQEAALAALRRASRESRERRIALCTPRLLTALRQMLLSRRPGVQVNAAAALVNLTLEATNKVRIVRSGVVPPLVDALKGGHPEARDHAAGAIFSLALEDANRAAIGVLGAIPPLLHLFSRSSESHRARRDAGMALYHLSLAGMNRSKISRTPGAVRALLAVAAEEQGVPAGVQGPPLGKLALMVVCNLAGSAEGRAALMDAGAVAWVVGLMRGEAAAAAAAAAAEYCVAALYGMSRGSLRFRGIARAAGAEKVLMRVAEAGSPGEVRREMARRTLRAMRGEEGEEEEGVVVVADEDGSVVSDGLVSFRRRYKDFGNGSGANSAEF